MVFVCGKKSLGIICQTKTTFISTNAMAEKNPECLVYRLDNYFNVSY